MIAYMVCFGFVCSNVLSGEAWCTAAHGDWSLQHRLGQRSDHSHSIACIFICNCLSTIQLTQKYKIYLSVSSVVYFKKDLITM